MADLRRWGRGTLRSVAHVDRLPGMHRGTPRRGAPRLWAPPSPAQSPGGAGRQADGGEAQQSRLGVWRVATRGHARAWAAAPCPLAQLPRQAAVAGGAGRLHVVLCMLNSCKPVPTSTAAPQVMLTFQCPDNLSLPPCGCSAGRSGRQVVACPLPRAICARPAVWQMARQREASNAGGSPCQGCRTWALPSNGGSRRARPRLVTSSAWRVLRRGSTGPHLPKQPLACLKTSSRQPGFAPCIDALENSASFPCTISCSFL